MLKNLSTTNMLYGIGAAIVILGALFKIQHWQGGSLLLTIGMITEALVFTYSAFEKKEDKIISSDPYDPSAIIKAQKEYVKEIKDAIKNISLINKIHKNQLKLVKGSTDAYKTINTEANSLAQHTYFMSKTYYSILKAMKG
tara:strand:- start:54 stop:476 length:423 start_codon:yes stop_codon:yes gene_type:complete